MLTLSQALRSQLADELDSYEEAARLVEDLAVFLRSEIGRTRRELQEGATLSKLAPPGAERLEARVATLTRRSGRVFAKLEMARAEEGATRPVRLGEVLKGAGLRKL